MTPQTTATLRRALPRFNAAAEAHNRELQRRQASLPKTLGTSTVTLALA